MYVWYGWSFLSSRRDRRVLGVVPGLFLTLPYVKFVHGIHRPAALVRSVLEASRGKD